MQFQNPIKALDNPMTSNQSMTKQSTIKPFPEFKAIADIIKAFKFPIALTYENGLIIGGDENFNIIHVIQTEIILPFQLKLCINSIPSVFFDVYSNFCLVNDRFIVPENCLNNGVNFNNSSYELYDNAGLSIPFVACNEEYFPLYYSVIQRVEKSINGYYSLMNHPSRTIHVDNLHENQQYQDTFINGKTADGVSLLRINGFIMSIYKGLLPISKADKVDLDIINFIDNERSNELRSTVYSNDFVGVFQVHKKKLKLTDSVYVHYINLV